MFFFFFSLLKRYTLLTSPAQTPCGALTSPALRSCYSCTFQEPVTAVPALSGDGPMLNAGDSAATPQ